MPRSVDAKPPQQGPSNGTVEQQGEDSWEQQGFDFNTPLARTTALTAITKQVVEEHWGQDAFAADYGMSRQLLNQKLRRAQNSKGETEKMHLDVVGFIATNHSARWDYLTKLCAEWGAKPPVPVREMSQGEKRNMLAAALTPEVKRDLERRYGLPAGSLDR